MSDCESFEIALEQRKLGDLSVDETTRLEAHLQGCPSCRAFEAFINESGRVMSQTANMDADKVDWEWIRRCLQRAPEEVRVRWALWSLGAVMVCLVMALSVSVDQVQEIFPFFLLLILGAMGVRYWLDRPRIRSARDAGRAVEGELMPFYLRFVGWQVKMARRAAWAWPLAALFIVGVEAAILPPAPLVSWLCRGVLMLEGLGMGLYWRFVALRRLEHVQQKLG